MGLGVSPLHKKTTAIDVSEHWQDVTPLAKKTQVKEARVDSPRTSLKGARLYDAMYAKRDPMTNITASQ